MSLEKGVCSCAELQSLFLLHRLKGSMSGEAREFNNIETRAVIKCFFFLQGKAPKEIHAILTETLEVHAPSYGAVKIGWTSLNVVNFPPSETSDFF